MARMMASPYVDCLNPEPRDLRSYLPRQNRRPAEKRIEAFSPSAAFKIRLKSITET
jgi:hypothetical protein